MIHQQKIEQEWKEENLPPFDEFIFSWNGTRPVEGQIFFYVSVKIDDWSPWLLYASWGSKEQSSFLSIVPDASVRVYQDTLEILKEKKATGFQIKIIQENCPHFHHFSLHVYTNGDDIQESTQKISYSTAFYLQVSGLSQMALNHPRCQDLCSPTATSAVIRYLNNQHALDPLLFAKNVHDKNFDIYGNWVLNAAQMAVELGPTWDCWVERLKDFDAIYEQLQKGIPVIVSIRGPLKGSASPYSQGHLIVVIGYAPLDQQVICMDPAFACDEYTHVRYDLLDFLQAWKRRGKVAYMLKTK